jgi:hypothetical protein
MVGDGVEVNMLKDEGLAHIVVGQVPEVLGGKGHLIDSLEARSRLPIICCSTNCMRRLPAFQTVRVSRAGGLVSTLRTLVG